MTIIVLTGVALSGCSAIHSKSVRNLIAKEGGKIREARKNFDEKVAQGTADRIIMTDKGIQSLSKSLETLRANEAAHSFIFSSYQNVSTKTGVDAQAVAYLIGTIYMAEHEGLEKKVLNQFKEDFAAMHQAKSQLSDSWKSLEVLHKRVQDYANKSVFASVDPELVDAIAQEVPGGSRSIDVVLRHSEQVNAALEEILGLGVVRSGAFERGRSVTTDLLDLLERVKRN
ncbi:MAG: hypothetical protein ACREJU_14545 [Nitrospiraceae bacterium]